MTTRDLFNKYKNNVSLAEGYYEYLVDDEDFKSALKEFAEFHVREALKCAIENAEIDDRSCYHEANYCSNTHIIASTITEAYPLDKIK